jgi:hypothetical protein
MRVCSCRVLVVWTLMSAWTLALATVSEAQVNPRDVPIATQPQQRFNAGQDIQPVFEGWTPNDDGSYNFLFGYINRNYTDRPAVPVGERNFFSPGEPDRGQTTYFYPRLHRYQFTVPVPASWGPEDELVWTVIEMGSEQKAFGWLQPEWEIDVNTFTSNLGTGFGRGFEELYANGFPLVTVSASATSVAVGASVTLTAEVTDDELPTAVPEPDPDRPRRREPALVAPEDAPDIPDNIKLYERPRPPRNHISVYWAVHRGPADGSFEPSGFTKWEEGMPGDGWTAATITSEVTFDTPGEYTLRAFVSDAMLLSMDDVTITVR